MIPPGNDQVPSQPNRIRWRKILSTSRFILPALLLFAAVGVQLWKSWETPFENDPNFVKTTRPTAFSFTGPGYSPWIRLQMKYLDWYQMRHPNPLAYRFSAHPGPVRCSINGLLNQCMEAGGIQYLIEKKVATGDVMFGPTNILNGQQWIEAFEEALQNGEAEWWDPDTKGFHKEKLSLIRYDPKTTLVMSKKAVAEYQKRYPKLK
jgi:hypothetical protein